MKINKSALTLFVHVESHSPAHQYLLDSFGEVQFSPNLFSVLQRSLILIAERSASSMP